jgi:hypothetical protein
VVALQACGGEDPDEVAEAGAGEGGAAVDAGPSAAERAADGGDATDDEPGDGDGQDGDGDDQDGDGDDDDEGGGDDEVSDGDDEVIGGDDEADDLPAVDDRDAGVRDASVPDAAPPQIGPIPTLPDCTAELFTLLSNDVLQPPRPASEGYDHPTGRAADALRHSIRSLVDGAEQTALESAGAAGYAICRAIEAGPLVFVWRPIVAGTGRAVVAWNAHEDARRIIFQAPHPYYDEGTLSQAVIAFRELRSRAVIVAGTHRCANGAPVVCSGVTEVCGDGNRQPFRVSDMAHNDETMFQAAHIALAEAFEDDRVVSLHGTGRRSGVVSDGTTDAASADALVARLTHALTAAFPDHPTQPCNAWPGGPATTRELCGTTNVQGRHLNGSSDACMERAPGDPDRTRRFVHLEQSPEMRDHFERVIEVLDAVLD